MTTPIEILVVGDWVVDENWVLTRHRSSTSTEEGRAHLRALGGVDSCVMTFCGAGRVARFLYWLNRFRESEPPGEGDWVAPDQREAQPLSIFGLGLWAPADEPKLYQMFHPSYMNGINPFTLRRAKPQHIPREQQDGLYLQNIAAAYSRAEKIDPWHDVGTTRVYRQYNLQAETPGGLVLDRRVDFELRFKPDGEEAGARPYNDAALQSLLRILRGQPADPQQLALQIWRRNLRREIEALAAHIQSELGTGSQAVEALLAAAEPLLPPSAAAATRAKRPFRYVVVKDLGKGTTTSKLLGALHAAKLVDQNTQWFISSKRFHPTYLDTLVQDGNLGKLRLLFLPPMAIAEMERDSINRRDRDGDRRPAIYRWFVADQHPTAESLEQLEAFLGSRGAGSGYPRGDGVPQLVVAMPKGLSLLAVEKEGEKRFGYCQPQTILDEVSEELSGRASMFFAALVAQLILSESGQPSNGTAPVVQQRDEMLEVALMASHDIVQGNIRALRNFGSDSGLRERPPHFPYDTSLRRYQRAARSGANGSAARFAIQVLPMDWKKARGLWRESREETGVVVQTGKTVSHRLDLWRAMDELDGYIEVVEYRRREIARLLWTLKDYLHQPVPSSFSAMLIARPGSGKSFLVSKLAAVLGMPPPLKFDITHLIRRQDINAWFDQIASAQAQRRNRVHLVFFDEINTLVENLNVYDLFLNVLEEGTYLRGGQVFKLDPCVWLFAGTTELQDELVDELHPTEEDRKLMQRKEPDLKSRLTLGAVRLDHKAGELDRRSLVYQGALQLQLWHPDVKKISARVLQAFFCLEEGTSNRRIRQLAGRFRNIQYGEVRERNLPDELKQVLVDSREHDSKWKLRFNCKETDDLDSILVDIERQPTQP